MTKLTESEARAEACAVVLRLILDDLDPNERKTLAAKAHLEGVAIGHSSVLEEIASLFE